MKNNAMLKRTIYVCSALFIFMAYGWSAPQLTKTSPTEKYTAADMLYSADSLAAEGKAEHAALMYRMLLEGKHPDAIRRGAVAGLWDLGRWELDQKDVKAKALFDGKTLKGWQGHPDLFYVAENAIVAGSLEKSIPQNEFLCAEREYRDFELQLDFKLANGKGNAGIQIRSQRIPNHNEMIGYQADIGQQYWGCLYDESRRKKVLVTADKKVIKKVLKPMDWNHYKIRCMGRRIQLWINGGQTVDYLEPDPKIPLHGLIGLQIHSGDPSEIRYKNITIHEFKIEDALKQKN